MTASISSALAGRRHPQPKAAATRMGSVMLLPGGEDLTADVQAAIHAAGAADLVNLSTAAIREVIDHHSDVRSLQAEAGIRSGSALMLHLHSEKLATGVRIL